MNKLKDLKNILIFQLITIPIVPLLFKFIEPKKVAAIFAGSLFVAFGCFSYFKILQWLDYRKNILYWLINMHLFAISIPIFLTRILNWSADFESLTIFFLPAPTFHKLSEGVYVLILVIVVWQLVRAYRRKAAS